MKWRTREYTKRCRMVNGGWITITVCSLTRKCLLLMATEPNVTETSTANNIRHIKRAPSLFQFVSCVNVNGFHHCRHRQRCQCVRFNEVIQLILAAVCVASSTIAITSSIQHRTYSSSYNSPFDKKREEYFNNNKDGGNLGTGTKHWITYWLFSLLVISQFIDVE